MQYSIYINQPKALEWGLNLQQAALFSFCYTLPSWADEKIINGSSYHWISKSRIVDSLPLLTDKPDTVKRLLKVLESKGLIHRRVVDKTKLFIRVTKKGRAWNEHNDGNSEVGKKIPRGREKNPRVGREKNPPNTNTINNNTKIINTVSNETECDNFWQQLREIYKKYDFKPGNKQPALKEIKKIVDNSTLLTTIKMRTEEHLRRKREILNNGDFTASPPHAVRWLKNRCWEDELDIISVNKTKTPPGSAHPPLRRIRDL